MVQNMLVSKVCVQILPFVRHFYWHIYAVKENSYIYVYTSVKKKVIYIDGIAFLW